MKLIFASIFNILLTMSYSQTTEMIRIECITSKPDTYFLSKKDSICLSMGINYKYVSYGCNITTEDLKECDALEKNNTKYFAYLTEKLGKDWSLKLSKKLEKIRK